MSPDTRPNFPNLRRAVDLTLARNAERESVAHQRAHDSDHRAHEAHEREQREHHLIAELHHEAAQYLDRSAFPSLIQDELSVLYGKLGVGKLLFLRDGWPQRMWKGDSHIDHKGPFELSDKVSYIGVNWDRTDETRIGLSLMSRRIERTFTNRTLYGMYVIADHLGTITVVGSGVQRLTRGDWEENPALQASALNRGFESPIFVRKGK